MSVRLNKLFKTRRKNIGREENKNSKREDMGLFSQIVDILQEGVWIIDKYNATSFVNPAMCNMLGYTHEEIIGKDLFYFMDERGIGLCKYLLARRKKGICEQHDFELIKKDGARIFVIMNTSPIKDKKGNYDGAVAEVMDVTSRRLAEEEKKMQSQNMVKMLDEERYKISENLHDGIGQTILAAKLNINIFKSDTQNNSERLNKAIELLDSASQEMRDICTNIYPGIIGEGGLEVAIHNNVQNTLGLCGIKSNINIKLKKKLPRNIEINIFRIIQEIIANTIRHSNAGSFFLDIRHENGCLCLTCEDDGHGFKNKKNEKHGCGLYNIQHRVDALGGGLVIDSASGSGTKISITIKDGKDE